MPHGRAWAGFEFTDLVRTILHRGKYGGDRGALEALGSLTASRLAAPRSPAVIASPLAPPWIDAPGSPDAVMPIPLGPRRRRHRGYNQAQIIAETLADAHRIPLLSGLQRTRETPPQTARDEDARRANVTGAFTWDGIALASATVWLVDDVLTTGATVEAAATVLAGSGASRIDVVVIAVVP